MAPFGTDSAPTYIGFKPQTELNGLLLSPLPTHTIWPKT